MKINQHSKLETLVVTLDLQSKLRKVSIIKRKHSSKLEKWKLLNSNIGVISIKSTDPFLFKGAQIEDRNSITTFSALTEQVYSKSNVRTGELLRNTNSGSTPSISETVRAFSECFSSPAHKTNEDTSEQQSNILGNECENQVPVTANTYQINQLENDKQFNNKSEFLLPKTKRLKASPIQAPSQQQSQKKLISDDILSIYMGSELEKTLNLALPTSMVTTERSGTNSDPNSFQTLENNLHILNWMAKSEAPITMNIFFNYCRWQYSDTDCIHSHCHFKHLSLKEFKMFLAKMSLEELRAIVIHIFQQFINPLNNLFGTILQAFLAKGHHLDVIMLILDVVKYNATSKAAQYIKISLDSLQAKRVLLEDIVYELTLLQSGENELLYNLLVDYILKDNPFEKNFYALRILITFMNFNLRTDDVVEMLWKAGTMAVGEHIHRFIVETLLINYRYFNRIVEKVEEYCMFLEKMNFNCLSQTLLNKINKSISIIEDIKLTTPISIDSLNRISGTKKLSHKGDIFKRLGNPNKQITQSTSILSSQIHFPSNNMSIMQKQKPTFFKEPTDIKDEVKSKIIEHLKDQRLCEYLRVVSPYLHTISSMENIVRETLIVLTEFTSQENVDIFNKLHLLIGSQKIEENKKQMKVFIEMLGLNLITLFDSKTYFHQATSIIKKFSENIISLLSSKILDKNYKSIFQSVNKLCIHICKILLYTSEYALIAKLIIQSNVLLICNCEGDKNVMNDELVDRDNFIQRYLDESLEKNVQSAKTLVMFIINNVVCRNHFNIWWYLHGLVKIMIKRGLKTQLVEISKDLMVYSEFLESSCLRGFILLIFEGITINEAVILYTHCVKRSIYPFVSGNEDCLNFSWKLHPEEVFIILYMLFKKKLENNYPIKPLRLTSRKVGVRPINAEFIEPSKSTDCEQNWHSLILHILTVNFRQKPPIHYYTMDENSIILYSHCVSNCISVVQNNNVNLRVP